MNNKKYNFMNDYVFKKIIGSEENIEITRDFLKNVTGNEYKDIEYRNIPWNEKELLKPEKGIIDVKLRADEFDDIDICVANDEILFNRLGRYWIKLYGEDGHFDSRRKKIYILIKDFDYKPVDDVPEIISEWNFYSEKHKDIPSPFTDNLRIIIVDARKWKKDDIDEKDNKDIVNWAKLLYSPEELEKSDLENINIRKAKEKLDEINEDENKKHMAYLRELMTQEEIELCKIEFSGNDKKIREKIAKDMKNRGVSFEDISEITSISKEKIENL